METSSLSHHGHSQHYCDQSKQQTPGNETEKQRSQREDMSGYFRTRAAWNQLGQLKEKSVYWAGGRVANINLKLFSRLSIIKIITTDNKKNKILNFL